MTTVHVRVETVEVASTDGQPTTGFRAYAADIGLSAESTDFTTAITAVKSAIDTYLGDTTSLIWLKGEMRFSTE
jgi:hypothetical protein